MLMLDVMLRREIEGMTDREPSRQRDILNWSRQIGRFCENQF